VYSAHGTNNHPEWCNAMVDISLAKTSDMVVALPPKLADL